MAKVAFLVSALCMSVAAAQGTCATFVESCDFPPFAKKPDTTACAGAECLVNECCQFTFSQTCNANELGCTGTEASKNFNIMTAEQAEKAGKPWPPPCESDPNLFCNVADCCTKTVVEDEGTPTTTFTPWDSSQSSSGESDSLESSYSQSFKESNAVDSWDSVNSSGSNASGSSGSYIKLYMWFALLACCLLCCAVILKIITFKPLKKAKKPKVPPPPVQDEEPLLPPLVPVVTTTTASFTPVASGVIPMAVSGVDANRDGRANFSYVGVDMNRDGIPDALQAQNPFGVAVAGTQTIYAAPTYATPAYGVPVTSYATPGYVV